jgi:hypothetical protein
VDWVDVQKEGGEGGIRGRREEWTELEDCDEG